MRQAADECAVSLLDYTITRPGACGILLSLCLLIGVELIFAHAALDFSGGEFEVAHPQPLVARSSKV